MKLTIIMFFFSQEQTLTSLQANLETFKFTKTSHETEMQSEMLSQLSNTEEEELENLTNRISQLQEQLKEMVHKRTKVDFNNAKTTKCRLTYSFLVV